MRAVSFDLWFTLIWSDPDLEAHFRTSRYRLLREYLASLGQEYKAEAIAVLERRVEEEVQAQGRNLAELSPKEILGRLLRLAGLAIPPPATLDVWAQRLSDAGFDRPPYLNPEAPAVLDALKQKGKRLAVISNVTRATLTYRRLLEHHRVLRYFDAVILSSELGAAKPARRIFEIALTELGAKPTEMAHVGDHYASDVVGASAAGITPVLYTGLWDRYRPEMQRKEPPNAPNIHIIRRLSDLLPLVG